jgi:hypothetical protein
MYYSKKIKEKYFINLILKIHILEIIIILKKI